jgi:outer membrane lipoprotein-sorting protein
MSYFRKIAVILLMGVNGVMATSGYQKKIQDYLNGLSTMTANFTQTSQSGRISKGTLTMKRPDKMRIDYDETLPQLIIAKNDTLYFYDLTDNSVSQYSTSSTPAGFILQKRILFNKDVYVNNLKESPEKDEVSMTLAAEESGEGATITLTFKTKPFLILDRWVIVDGQGNHTTVNFDRSTIRIGIDIDEKKFNK